MRNEMKTILLVLANTVAVLLILSPLKLFS